MKKVLFIGITNYDFKEFSPLHLKKKFLGLSKGLKPYILARGKPFHKRIWNTDFYLLPSGLFFWPLAIPLAFYLCLVKRIEVVIAQSPLIEGFVGAIIKKILGKELIVEMHGDWKEGTFLSKKRKFEVIEKKITPFLAKFSLKNADKIRAISIFTKKEAIKISGLKPYFLFPTFTDIDIFLEEKGTLWQDFILFVGALSLVKNIRILIEAFSKIEKEFPNFKLTIIGEGPERKNLESKVKSLNLGNKVEFKGRLSLEETKNIMKKCYCFVLPSLSEGLGRVLMEAEALGKPVIGSRVGGIPDLVKNGQNGFLFEVGDLDDLVEKLRILLKYPDLAIKMGKQGREFIRSNFSNEKYIKNYISMINA